MAVFSVKGTLFLGQSIDGKRGVTEGGRRSAGPCLSGCFVVLRRHVSCGVMPGMNGLFSGANGACFYRWGFSVLCFMPFWAVVQSSGFPCFCSSVVPAFVFLLMPELVLVIGAQRVLDSRAENPDGRRFMRAFHVRGVGAKVRAKKNPPEGGLVGNRETDARGLGGLRPEAAAAGGACRRVGRIRPWRRRSDGPLRPS